MKSTLVAVHEANCPYRKWHDENAKWQPSELLSELTREIMVETICNCERVA